LTAIIFHLILMYLFMLEKTLKQQLYIMV